MRYVAVLLSLLPQVLSGLRGVTVSVPGDQKYLFSAGWQNVFKSCVIISSWCALPYNSEFEVETFDKFSADSLSAFKLILLSHLGIIFSFFNRKDAISKTCNIQYTKYDWMGWSFNIVNVQI